MEQGNVIQFPEKKQLNLIEAAAYLGKAPNTLRNWLGSGRGPRCIKKFGRLVFLKVDLDRFLENNVETREAYR